MAGGQHATLLDGVLEFLPLALIILLPSPYTPELLLTLFAVPLKHISFLILFRFQSLLSFGSLQRVLFEHLEVLVLLLLQFPLDLIADPTVEVHGGCQLLPLHVQLLIFGLLHTLLKGVDFRCDLELLIIVIFQGGSQVCDTAMAGVGPLTDDRSQLVTLAMRY